MVIEHAPRITRPESEYQRNQFITVLERGQESVDAPEDPFSARWEGIIPRKEYSIVEVVSAQAPFIRGYKGALVAGTNDKFISEVDYVDVINHTLGIPTVYTDIYRINNLSPQGERDELVVANFQPDSLNRIGSELDAFIADVETSDMPEPYITEYVLRAQGEKQQIKATEALGTPEFTNAHKTPKQWGEFIDIEASLEAGHPVLPFEQAARDVLEKSKTMERREIPIHEALNFWNLSEPEKELIGVADIPQDALRFSTTQYAKLFEVLLTRAGLDVLGWEVEITDAVTATSVEASERKIKVAAEEVPTGFDAKYIAVHEMIHAVRGENGYKQGFKLLSTGVDEYPLTEEGAGAAAEMIAGEKFGDARQIEIAGRYLAISMSLKTEVVNGVRQPKHTPQEIYQTLRDYGVTEADATATVWRNQRGTSLTRKVTMIDVEKPDGEIVQIPAAETFTKDTIYFEGQMQLFKWIIDHMPVKEGHWRSETLDNYEFSDKLLARVGSARRSFEGRPTRLVATAEERRNSYNELVDEGRAALFDILNLMSAGKFRLDFLKDGSPWYKLLNFGKRNGMIEYTSIFTPVEDKPLAA